MRLISTYAAGGSSDISLRILAEFFEGRLGQKFFVENRPGREVNYALDHINRRILQSFARSGIQFAHPIRTLWLRRAAEHAREQIVSPE